MITYLSNLLSGLDLSDVETGCRMFRAEIPDQLEFREDGFGFEPGVVAKIVRNNYQIREVPVFYDGRSRSNEKSWTGGTDWMLCVTSCSTTCRNPGSNPPILSLVATGFLRSGSGCSRRDDRFVRG